MELVVSCDTAEGKIVLLHPETAEHDPATVEGLPIIAKDSGDGSFTFDTATPDRFIVLSGAAEGVSVFSVKGHSVGGPDVVDTVKLNVSLAIPVLADFGMTDGGTIKK